MHLLSNNGTIFEQIFLLCFGVQNDSVVLGLKPFHSIILVKHMRSSNAAIFAFSVSYIHTGTAKDHIEIHTYKKIFASHLVYPTLLSSMSFYPLTIDTNRRIVFDTQINVFLNTETEIAVLTKVITT